MKDKRKKIIIIIFIMVLTFVSLWFLGFLNKKEQKDLLKETKNLFPFGKVENKRKTTKQENQQIDDENNQEFIEEKQDVKEEKEGPRLRQITNFPTGGFIPLTRVEDKEITDIVIDSDGVSNQIVKTIKVKNDYVRYSSIENASIFETKVTPYSLTEELLVENFIPNTEYTFFSKDGTSVLFQYWNKAERLAETYLGKIKKRSLDIKPCPYSFDKQIHIGDEGKHILDLHTFLNLNKRTRVSISGINSPGNEGSLATEATITAIKNFQSLNNLDIDGELGSETKKKMLEICDAYEKEKAEKKFNALKTKYDISGVFLPQNIISIGFHPKENKVFYIQKDKIGVIGVIKDLVNKTKKTIFESPYSEWIAQWNNKDNIQLTTKASYQSKGYTYHLNVNTGDFHKSFKEKQGLTTLASPNNKKIFIHEVTDKYVLNFIYNKKTNKFKKLNIQTFPEKCVWGYNSLYLYCAVPDTLAYDNQYPDTWYQGLEDHNDSLWKINAITGKSELISDIYTEFNEGIDVFKIDIDSQSNYLYFINKKDETLWSYRLMDI
jgi:hypothetical protein